MIYTVTWGKRICQTTGWGRRRRTSKIIESTEFGEIWFDEDTLTNAKRKASRHVNAQPLIKEILRNLSEDKKRWKAWKPDISGIDGVDKYGRKITYTSKESDWIHGSQLKMGNYLVAYIRITIVWTIFRIIMRKSRKVGILS